MMYRVFNNGYGGRKTNTQEMLVHLLIAALCFQLTDSQLRLVIALVLSIIKMMSESNNPFPNTTIGSSLVEWKKYYRGTGKQSILSYIPSASVTTVDNHAVIDPIAAIEEILASGVTIQDFTEIGNKKTSPIFHHVCDSATKHHNAYPVGYSIFSDGFETSAVVRDQGSTWFMILMAAAPGSLKRSRSHCKVIALGPGDKSHEKVFQFVNSRLQLLSRSPKLMTLGAIGHPVPTHCVMTSYSADLPERHSICYTLSYASPLHRQFGYILYIPNSDWTKFHLHSCCCCFEQRVESIISLITDNPSIDASNNTTINTCQNCSDWDYYHPRNFSKPTHKYPTTMLEGSPPCPPGRPVSHNVKIGVYIPSFENQKMACALAHHNYVSNHWTKVIAREYL